MPGRMKGFHYYNAGLIFDALMALIRPILSKKLQDRVRRYFIKPTPHSASCNRYCGSCGSNKPFYKRCAFSIEKWNFDPGPDSSQLYRVIVSKLIFKKQVRKISLLVYMSPLVRDQSGFGRLLVAICVGDPVMPRTRTARFDLKAEVGILITTLHIAWNDASRKTFRDFWMLLYCSCLPRWKLLFWWKMLHKVKRWANFNARLKIDEQSVSLKCVGANL